MSLWILLARGAPRGEVGAPRLLFHLLFHLLLLFTVWVMKCDNFQRLETFAFALYAMQDGTMHFFFFFPLPMQTRLPRRPPTSISG